MSIISNGLLLDTHAWVWLQEGNTIVSRAIVRVVQGAMDAGDVYVSTISVWEIGNLTRAGRMTFTVPVDGWLARAYRRLQVLPIDSEVALTATRLPGDIHRDPADRILAATARLHDLTLMTNDRQLLAYAKQGHIKARSL